MGVEIKREDVATVTVTFKNGDSIVATPKLGFLIKEEIREDREPDRIFWKIWWFEHGAD